MVSNQFHKEKHMYPCSILFLILLNLLIYLFIITNELFRNILIN